MTLSLSLHTAPDVPLETPCLNPDSLIGMNSDQVKSQIAMHGNETVEIGDFFDVSGECSGEIQLEGDLSRVKYIGAQMRTGSMMIKGDVGAHLGSGMHGGNLTVEGNAADWVGPEMSGGRITIKGNVGHLAGSVHRGGSVGMTGGEIFIHGTVRNELGHGMRNGLIVVGGNAGDFAGVNMLAGTIVVLGSLGIRPGAGMKRGSIISTSQAEILPTFALSCLYRPAYLRLLFRYIRQSGFEISNDHLSGSYQRWCGDAVEMNRGEILIYNET